MTIIEMHTKTYKCDRPGCGGTVTVNHDVTVWPDGWHVGSLGIWPPNSGQHLCRRA